MRISDWSSDVCSSDLTWRSRQAEVRSGLFLGSGFVLRTADEMIVDDTDRLQVRIDDCAADELEAALQQIPADAVGQFGLHWHVAHRAYFVDQWLDADVVPEDRKSTRLNSSH